MAAHHIAKGLASLGRNGDTMLMHVSPQEVEGLKALGAVTGRKVTTNPHTGLPEAFDFGDFFSNLVPMGIGMLLGPEVLGTSILGEGGLGLTGTALKVAQTALPVVGGMAAGAALGQNPVMSALSAYGGSSVGGNFAKMGAGGGWAPGQAIPQAVGSDLGVGGYGQGMATTLANQAPAAATATASQGLSNLTSGIGKAISDPSSYTGSKFGLAAPLVSAGLAGAQEDLFPTMSEEELAKQKELANKYRDPLTGGLNLSADPGLRLYATGGTVNNQNTASISGGGLQDLYGANDNMTGNTQLSQDGYGIGRLDKLASAGSNAKAADEFYAKGGYLDGAGDGMSDSIPATIEGKQPARLADGEFVIPADVVSHLGNGSTKAGAKHLYKAMNKIRKARTGTTKQGRQINPNNYLPA